MQSIKLTQHIWCSYSNPEEKTVYIIKDRIVKFIPETYVNDMGDVFEVTDIYLDTGEIIRVSDTAFSIENNLLC